MTSNEHRRLRLAELLENAGMTQAAFASLVDVPPDYVSRLLYPEDKAGRKNLGLVTMGKITTAFGLPTQWFEEPLGTNIPAPKGIQGQHSSTPAISGTLAQRLASADDATRKLVEIALYENDEEAIRHLTPSLVAMVRGLKALIAEQGRSTP